MATHNHNTLPVADTLRKIPTGIKGLDEITDGGLPQGRPTLVCGGTGCGKTLLAMEFLVHGATRFDEPGVFMSFEEKTDELAKNFASLGFDLNALVGQDRLAIDYVHVEPGEIEETGEYDLEGLIIRLGYAIDNVLLYGTGGLAYGHMEADSDFKVTSGDTVLGKWDGSADTVNWGWTIGAGMEYGIDNWSLGLEYLYVDLGSAEWDNDFNTSDIEEIDSSDFDGDANIDYQFSVVRATAKLRF